MTSHDPISSLEKIAPELKKEMKNNNCKGLVMLVHDEETNAIKLKNKAKELGLNPEFVVGGHVHHSYINNNEHIYFPEPFGLSMTHFTLDIDKKQHKLSNLERILPEKCNLGKFEKKIKEVELAEKYNEPIAKSIIELNYKYKPQYKMTLTELGTFYADAIKNIVILQKWIF